MWLQGSPAEAKILLPIQMKSLKDSAADGLKNAKATEKEFEHVGIKRTLWHCTILTLFGLRVCCIIHRLSAVEN